jgi:hypothetical protein
VPDVDVEVLDELEDFEPPLDEPLSAWAMVARLAATTRAMRDLFMV